MKTPDQANPTKKEEFIPFEKFVKLGEKLTKEQAIEVLKSFHKTSSEAILAAFGNLRNLKDKDEAVVIFDTSISNSSRCLKIECRDKDGKWLSTSLVNEYTGQPIYHTS